MWLKAAARKEKNHKSMDLTSLDAGDIKINKLTISDPKAPSLVMKTKHV